MPVWSPASGLTLSSSEQAILNAISNSDEIPARVRVRAKIILKAGEGIPNNRIANDLLMKRPRVLHWRRRYVAQGIRGLWDADRTPPRERIPEAVEQAVLFDCFYHSRLHPRIGCEDDLRLCWNVHNLASRHGISPASVSRIWKKHGIQMGGPCGIKMDKLKISPDPLFPVTICRIGGLLYDLFWPIVAFCSTPRPFSELALSPLTAPKRDRLVEGLADQFHSFQAWRHKAILRTLLTDELADLPRADLPRDVLNQFVAAISAKQIGR